MSRYAKIDCHSHYLPPSVALRPIGDDADLIAVDIVMPVPRTATKTQMACLRSQYADGSECRESNANFMPQQWSPESHLEMMKTVNVTKSILSISSPGTHLKAGDTALAREVTKYCNDYAADLKKQKPEQFGFFASLPLVDVEGCLEEIPRALDELDADGFVVETNFHGSYLGDKAFDPIFDELNRRKAIVFMHPTTPCLKGSGTAATPLPDFPRPMFEFLFDTARAVINLFLSGTVSRCPNVTFLVPHVGGTFPPLINRFATFAMAIKIPGVDSSVNPAWVKERLNKQFYFDTAGWAFPEQIKGLLEYVTVERMLYGSDFPFTPLPIVNSLSQMHDQYLPEVFPDEEDREKLCSGNALKLLARRS